MKKVAVLTIAVFAAIGFTTLGTSPANAESPVSMNHRQTLSLDGTWQIAQGDMTNIPTIFDSKVPVPGLVDMAKPPFIDPGPKVADRKAIHQKDPRRDAFWYRKTFNFAGPIPPVAMLKVNKAKYGTRVYLNGQLLGDYPPCFTPGFFDAKDALKIGENKLVIRVGADRDAVGLAIPSGFDFEKERYIPGIYDSVKLILSGTPHIVNVQVAPDITNQQARVRLWLEDPTNGVVTVEVSEAKSGKIVGNGSVRMTAGEEEVLNLVVPISGCHLWSPKDPFLYRLTARTSGDEFTTRFGMREFRFDPATGRAMLNGKPYFMRGSNITLYRFFEDSERGDLPWNKRWVRKLFERVKNMHWNCLRFCIGFPPEMWYRLADEEGILIEDEFPIWFGGPGWSVYPKELRSAELAKEYADWMRDRWNHPCVVIWDACNETFTDQTGSAIRQVRGLDMSGRPWDNSYTCPQEPGDMLESHPYFFHSSKNSNFKLADLATTNPVPQGNVCPNDGKHAVVINEYGWLWLNRDGTPTTQTRNVYKNLLGTNSTTAQRRHLRALYVAAETEFWRAHRKAAAVMCFTTLGYSRPDGQTSDDWMQGGVAKLKWDPQFYKYVRDAFAPVGMCIGFWNDYAQSGDQTHIPVTLINDLYTNWSGPVTLRVKRGHHVLVEKKQAASSAALGTTNVVFNLTWPKQIGPCVLETELRGADGKPVHCVRDLNIK